MSGSPPPPTSIALAIARYTRGSPIPGDNDERLAQAVWDALLAEGRIEDYDDYHAFVLPIPVSVDDPQEPHDA